MFCRNKGYLCKVQLKLRKMEQLILEFEQTRKASNNFVERTKHTWNLSNQITIDEVLADPDFKNFKRIGYVEKTNGAAGFKIVALDDFKDKKPVLYILVIQKYVIKGGKVKNELETRSYSAGTEKAWTDKGNCSDTNYTLSQVFRKALEMGLTIDFYGIEIPATKVVSNTFSVQKITYVSTYECDELTMIELLTKLNGKKLIGQGDFDYSHK